LTMKVGKCLSNASDTSADCTQFTTEISNLSKLLVDLLSYLDDDSNEPWNAKIQELGGKDGLLYQYKCALEQLKHKISDGRGMKKIGKTLLWKYIKEDIERILLKIERLKSLVQIALEMDHLKLSQVIKYDMDIIHGDNKAIKIGVGAIQQDQQRDKILEWISSSNFPAQQSDLIARRQEETGLWFLNAAEFTEWVHGSNQSLFCPGIPGAGKTMLASIAVDHLYTKVQSRNIGVAYVFCNYKTRADQNATYLLAAIIKQLVQARASITEPVTRLYNHHTNRGTKPSLNDILSTLHSLLDKLRGLQNKTGLRLMATSRVIPSIVDIFNGVPTLEVRARNADVEQFIIGQTHRLPRCIQRDDNLQKLVQEKIVEAVDGMFLLARLHVDSLLDKDTKKKVRSTLKNLSRGSEALNKAYDEAIERIESQLPGNTARAKSVLSWISHAERPLTTGELCHALAVELEEEELDQENIPHVDDIVSVCAGLVTIDEESNIIRLVHYTTQEYFEQIRERWNYSAQYGIASSCIRYLCFKPFRSGSCPSNAAFESRLEQNIFLDYSARYWGQHALAVQERVSKLALCLLQDISLVACAVQSSLVPDYKYRNYSQSFPKQATGLHLAASFGLLEFSKELLSRIAKEKSIFADSKDGEGRTPLSWAAGGGREAVVKLLAGRDDVEADAKDGDDQTPLSWAARGGHEAVVKLLVERDDVEADSKDGYGRTPLSWAAEGGHEVVVKLLVERDDVDADSKDGDGRTPLSWAAWKGHEAVVKLLVEQG
ncbi:uncharacterized protein BDR25DRAFT_185539, partial [Lindgomyces ingoldianus]